VVHPQVRQDLAEVLQLCSHPVLGWQDAPPGIFGLWSIQDRDVEELLAERGLRADHVTAMGPAVRARITAVLYAVT
jgi:hypothetical protein